MSSMVEPRRPISDAEIIELYRAGHSQHDITRRYDVTVLHTRDVLQNAGFNTHNFRSLSHTMIRVVRQLVPNGVIYRDIEAVCDLSFHAIRDYVLRTQLKSSVPAAFRVDHSHHKHNFSTMTRRNFLSGYRAGKSFCRLVDELDLNDQAIYAAYSAVTHKDIVQHRANLGRIIEIEHAKGFSYTAVAKNLDISRSIVRARLRR